MQYCYLSLCPGMTQCRLVLTKMGRSEVGYNTMLCFRTINPSTPDPSLSETKSRLEVSSLGRGPKNKSKSQIADCNVGVLVQYNIGSPRLQIGGRWTVVAYTQIHGVTKAAK